MPDVIDFDKAADEFKHGPPFSTHKPKKERRAAPPAWTKTPVFQARAVFPEDAAAILKRNKISRKQFTRYAEAIALEAMRICTPDFLIALQKGIRLGDNKQIELFAKMSGLIKNDAQTVINLGQSVTITNNGGSGRHFDSIIRSLDDRDRASRVEPPAITVDAIEVSEVEDASLA